MDQLKSQRAHHNPGPDKRLIVTHSMSDPYQGQEADNACQPVIQASATIIQG